MKKILIITYYWPPGSGAGVQRWLKFSKYLPQYGWEPLILTVDPQYAAYPAIDHSLEKEIPGNVRVFRTKAIDWFRLYAKDKSGIPSAGFAINPDNSFKGKFLRFIRGNFFIPDPRRGWNRFAFRRAVDIIKQEGINNVITTSPPHSTQLIGLRLKNKFPAIKWISDLRDPWTGIYYYRFFYPSFFARSIDSCYEKNVIRKADTVITVGESLAGMIKSFNKGDNASIHVIPNGFDEEDFREVVNITPERYTITYVGTLSGFYPVDGLLSALEKVKSKGFDFLLRFVGSVPENIKRRIETSVSCSNVEFIPHTSHSEAINYMASSSVLLLIIPDHSNNKAIITGKLFEYIASAKPVLFIGPVDGDAAGHLRLSGNAGIFSGLFPEEIEGFILKTMRSGESKPLIKHRGYSRKELTQKLAEVLAG